MSYNWGPHYIVPTEVFKSYSGVVVLREEFDKELLRKELEELGITGPVVNITNPWYCRRNGTDTWIKIGESEDEQQNFPTRWDTTSVENGKYEVMGLMHVFAKRGGEKTAIARQNIVEVTVEN